MSDAEDMVVSGDDVAPVDADVSWGAAFATTAHEDDIPEDAAHVLRITPEEMGYLKVLSWGDGVHRETCEVCHTEMVFERHPASWDNHPDGVRVRIECQKCGHMQWTDGVDETEYVEQLNAALMAQVREEVAKRLQAANGGKPVSIADIRAGDLGGGIDQGHAPTAS